MRSKRYGYSAGEDMIKDCPLCTVRIFGDDKQQTEDRYWSHIARDHPAELYRAIRETFEIAHAHAQRVDCETGR